MYGLEGEVPDGDYEIPFAHARLARSGTDVTIVSSGQMVALAEQVADALSTEGTSCDVIDLRTTSPMDEESILDSVEQTGRLVIVDEGTPRCGLAADIAGLVSSQAFAALKAPIAMVTAPHTPVPFARELERAYLPSAVKIERAVRSTLEYA
jgi:pyruvate dehydrogenase E1 component beta subunit